MFDEIAKAIGYHFWYPKSDGEAIACGSACAADVMMAIEATQQSVHATACHVCGGTEFYNNRGHEYCSKCKFRRA